MKVLIPMTKRKLPTEPYVLIGEDIDAELLYAAAEAHPDWEVLPKGLGVKHLRNDTPRTPKELLDWFMKKGRH